MSSGIKAGYEWRRCRRCHLHYIDLVNNRDLQDEYKDYYGTHSPIVPRLVQERLDRLMRTFERRRSCNRLLDVGFGAGSLLRAAAARGWSCWGTELASASLETGRAEGWRVHEGHLTDAQFPEKGFDVICFVEVLEHLSDPMSYLREAARLLRPGGLVFGTTPNGQSINGRVLGIGWSIFAAPEHLQIFSPTSLRCATSSVGFHLEQIRADGFNPIELTARGRDISGIQRVESAYAANEKLTGHAVGRTLKNAANWALSSTLLGDSLKFYAVSGHKRSRHRNADRIR